MLLSSATTAAGCSGSQLRQPRACRGPAAARLPPLARPGTSGSSTAARRGGVCKFRDRDDAEVGVASRPSWRRHFTESDPPDEGAGPQGLVQQAKAAMRDSPIGLADIALPTLGALGGFAINDAHDWSSVGVGIAAGVAARLIQGVTIEQKVPFTLRKHSLLLPVFAELLLGQFSFAQVLQQPQYRGKALEADHPDAKLVQRIADRIIGAVEQGHGGGFQKHIQKFDWEVVVLDVPDVNAFVLPGGKIVVFSGIIKLMDRNEDMLATIIGHECAHALARHSSEKITLGLFIALAVQLAAYGLQRTVRSGQPYYDSPYAQQDPRRDPRHNPRLDPRYHAPDPRYGRNPYANPYDNPYYNYRRPYTTSPRGRNIYWVMPPKEMLQSELGESAGPRFPPGYGRPGPGGRGGGSPVGGLVQIATNLLLQLPFSRRAEAEADLIGLKLMALAGYKPDAAPTTFAKMEEYQGKMMGKAAANASYIQDHPRSANRVKLLEGELELMKRFGREGKEVVLSKVPYWML